MGAWNQATAGENIERQFISLFCQLLVFLFIFGCPLVLLQIILSTQMHAFLSSHSFEIKLIWLFPAPPHG